MDAFEFSELVNQQGQSGERYLEFLAVPAMSLGIYSLPAGGVDTQQPHTEDEIYYIVSGRCTMSVDGDHSNARMKTSSSAPPVQGRGISRHVTSRQVTSHGPPKRSRD